MPTSKAGTSGNRTDRRGAAGFTLIELAVVVFIIGLTALLVYPKIAGKSVLDLRTSARSVAATIRYVQDSAATAKKTLRLVVDLDRGTLSVREISSEGKEVSPADPLLQKTEQLPDGIFFAGVTDERLGKIASGTARIDFVPHLPGRYLAINLRSDDGSNYSVKAYPRSGRVKVFENYTGAEE